MDAKRSWPYYNGYVILQDHMGSDLSVVNAAKVSFNRSADVIGDKETKLIAYLAKHKHMSPFRHVQFSLILKDIPEVVLRQLYKHQVGIAYTAGDYRDVSTVWNEVSGRYVEVGDKFFYPDAYRPQHTSNKQASFRGQSIKYPWLAQCTYKASIALSQLAYRLLLRLGVCREQARFLMPLAFSTSVYWTASLEALAHFVKLRNHEGAQVEIQQLAEIVHQIIASICPVATAELLRDHA